MKGNNQELPGSSSCGR